VRRREHGWVAPCAATPHQVSFALAKGNVAMTIASRLDNGMSKNQWLKPSGDGVFSAVSELVPTIFAELQP
jgi:hypothetical protein